MRGEVLSYDAITDHGLISGDDLMRYGFSRADVAGREEPVPGLRVDFIPLEERASQIILLQVQDRGLPASAFAPGEAPLSMWAYFVRCIRQKYVDGEGRARRLEYWSFVLFAWLTMTGAMLTIFMVTALLGGFDGDTPPVTTMFALLLVFGWMLLLAIPGISVAVRRLHDVGLSGWLYLLTFIPYVGGLFMLVIGCIPSQPHPNAYGPAPRRF
ncbi:DUF805 domain-containing protein [Brevundimonas pondensis]|uniref:DUF805 domain-containing protein n=1 Tax=Brevundimonas pondensis TaxID=2774189 RepID=UPI00320AB1A7